MDEKAGNSSYLLHGWLSTGNLSAETNRRVNKQSNIETSERTRAETLISRMGWGSIFLFSGILLVIPNKQHPGGSFLLGSGIIMLLIYIARRICLRKHSLLNFLFSLALILIGWGKLANLGYQVIPVILLLAGIYILVRSLLKDPAKE